MEKRKKERKRLFTKCSDKNIEKKPRKQVSAENLKEIEISKKRNHDKARAWKRIFPCFVLVKTKFLRILSYLT